MNPLLRAGAVLYVALIVGCAGEGVLPLVGEMAAAPFDLSGRIVAHDREQGFAGALRWQHRAQTDEIWFNTPLGQSFAHLQADADGATLTTADGKQYRAASIESLTKSALGWRLPVALLRYWVRGVPALGMTEDDVERDDTKRLTRFTQGKWRVTLDYAGDTVTTPSRIEVAGDAAEIRLVIDRFESLPP